ncbi:acetylcholine receptor subunit beta-like, partial [Saccostrea echinata]|uniref:acetylcholine receptor subunit beta-like n=1 Tax=Saccostrea echinata TaxID=191078 RepID=UPI002A819C18
MYDFKLEKGFDVPRLSKETTNRSQLFKDILDNHEVRVAPFNTIADSIPLSISLSIMSIRKVNEKDKTFSASVWISMAWDDYRLMWDPASYMGIKQLQTTSKYVWIPSSVCVFNDVTDNKCLTEEKPVSVLNNGNVIYTTAKESLTQCQINVQKYPFDSQTCSLRFGNLFAFSEFLNFSAASSYYSLYFFEQSEEWEVQNASVTLQYTPAMTTELHFNLNIKRKPGFVVLTVLLPVIILSVLNVFAFVLPIDSGEKMGTSMSIFLTFAFFLTMIIESLPKSDDIPPFTVYLTMQLMISGLTVVLEAVVLHVHFKTDNNAENKAEKKVIPIDMELEHVQTESKRNLITFVKSKLTANVLDRIFLMFVIIVDFISL